MEKILWVLNSITDLYENSLIVQTHLSVRNLSGKGLAGNRGTVDLLLLKFTFKNVMLDEVLGKMQNLSSEQVSKVRGGAAGPQVLPQALRFPERQRCGPSVAGDIGQ